MNKLLLKRHEELRVHMGKCLLILSLYTVTSKIKYYKKQQCDQQLTKISIHGLQYIHVILISKFQRMEHCHPVIFSTI